MSNWKFKKIGKHIFIHYFIALLGVHSNINALLCLGSVLASMYRYSWLITFEIFRIFFFGIEGCIVSKLFLDFYIFFIFTWPLMQCW